MMRVCLMNRFLPCRALEFVRRNARFQARRIAGARDERTLIAIACKPLFGVGSGTDTGLTHPQHVSHPCKVHLLQHRATEQAVGIAERLDDFEMVIALADEELDRFPPA
jgi:hypothetical protein